MIWCNQTFVVTVSFLCVLPSAVFLLSSSLQSLSNIPSSWHTEIHIWNLLNLMASHYSENPFPFLMTEFKKKKTLNNLSLTYPTTILCHWPSLHNSCLLPTESHSLQLHNFWTSLLSWHMLQSLPEMSFSFFPWQIVAHLSKTGSNIIFSKLPQISPKHFSSDFLMCI